MTQAHMCCNDQFTQPPQRRCPTCHDAEEPQQHGHDMEPLPELLGAQPETSEALQPPAQSDLRPLSPREHPYDRVHRPGYTLPGSVHD